LSRIGILFSHFGTAEGSAELFKQIMVAAEAAERASVSSITVMDHVHQHPPFCEPADPMPEAYVLLGAIAARTTAVRLGTLVTGVTYRNPALLAKMVTTLDMVSGGRAFLGVGASWHGEEYHAYGFGEHLPPIGERIDRLEEALQICRGLFTAHESSFRGRYYSTDHALNFPRPVQPSGPPILVGGTGEQRMLKLVAQHADISNMLGRRDELRHKLDVLDGHCARVARDPAEIRRTHTCMAVVAPTSAEAERRAAAVHPGQSRSEYRQRCIAGDPGNVAEQAAELFGLGLDELIVFTDRLWTEEDLALLGDVIDRFE
jgi:F420-dependent oxidoreductase-like protein